MNQEHPLATFLGVILFHLMMFIDGAVSWCKGITGDSMIDEYFDVFCLLWRHNAGPYCIMYGSKNGEKPKGKAGQVFSLHRMRKGRIEKETYTTIQGRTILLLLVCWFHDAHWP